MGDKVRDRAVVRRRRRVVAAAVLAVVVVGGAFAGPHLVGRDDDPSAAPGPDCVAETDAAAAEIGVQDARWVRFCPLADTGGGQRLRYPQGVVTGDLAASIADTLWETQAERPVCDPAQGPGPGPTGLFRIEVGLADGRVAELSGDTGCSTRDVLLFSQLETTLLMAAVDPAAQPAPPPDPVVCPGRLTTTATNRDGASAGQLVDDAEQYWLSTVPLLPQPAVAVDVCSYTGRGRGLTLLEQWQGDAAQAETVRSTATIAHDRGARTDCAGDARRASYVVVLTDATGTARTLTIDGAACGVLDAAIGTPATDTWLGLARRRLVRVVARSRPTP